MLRGALLLIVLLLSGCGPSAAAPTPTPAPTAPTAPTAPPQRTTELPGSNAVPDPQPAVDAALNDAAAHLGVVRDQLHVDQVDPHQWPDSSLGCAQPGIMYSQIVTPGFLIVISASSGKQLEYHTDGRSRVVLCKET